ncbi:hypothetical protein [Butyrivibrio sp. AE3004]|uniref:hypothetical protein n=1 Tax=Butyrivibrio sp. AE3004 TaxID=1506994 RepID=UPI000AAF75B6|nr:hypothetical protein [Butyrivibrio sp. AE3004]
MAVPIFVSLPVIIGGYFQKKLRRSVVRFSNLMRGDWGCAPTSEQNVDTSAPLATLACRFTGDGAGDAF